MLTTAVVTLFMPARIGPLLFSHFGFIHLFSFLVMYAVPRAYVTARSGMLREHRANRVGVYCGGILIAGALAFSPGRLLHGWLVG